MLVAQVSGKLWLQVQETLSNLTITAPAGYTAAAAAIEIDKTLLVDENNDSTSDWSSQGTLTNNNPGTTGYAQAFNGITDEGETYVQLQMGLMVALVGMLTVPKIKMVKARLLVLTGNLIVQLS